MSTSASSGDPAELRSFLSACVVLLGRDGVAAGSVQEDLTGQQRDVAAVVRPRSVEDVQAVLRFAEAHGVPLYPVSRGRNWGLGSDSPVAHGCVRVELAGMNRIRSVDDCLGTATIEPGVTQRMLAEHLVMDSVPFFIDVTGAGPDTSLLGNALERGVGYIGCRENQLINLEVVLASGRVVRTGLSHWEHARRPNAGRCGLGPSLEGLFLQSNMGIVTAATFDLQPLPAAQANFSLAIRDLNALGAAIDALRSLLMSGTLTTVPHIFDRNRLLWLMTPRLLMRLREIGQAPDVAEVQTFIDRAVPQSWFIGGTLMGEPALVRGARRVLRERLEPLGALRIFGTKAQPRLLGMLRCLGMSWTVALTEAMAPLAGLNRGQPTDAAMASIIWPALGPNVDLRADIQDPDRSLAGLRTCTMLCPMVGEDALQLITITRAICDKAGVSSALSLNGVSARSLEVVISLAFRRADPDQVAAARECHLALLSELREAGFTPHRATIDTMPEAMGALDPFWDTVNDIKRIFDPAGIVAPGRYDPSVLFPGDELLA